MPVDRLALHSATSKLRTNTPTAASVGVVGSKLAFRDSDGNIVELEPLSEVPDLLNAVTALSADGAIPKTSGVYKITKETAAALTLAAPTADEEGTVLIIHSQTDAAHVITATNLIADGVTGGGKDTATFAAFAGASIVLRAINLLWSVEAKNGVTIAADE